MDQCNARNTNRFIKIFYICLFNLLCTDMLNRININFVFWWVLAQWNISVIVLFARVCRVNCIGSLNIPDNKNKNKTFCEAFQDCEPLVLSGQVNKDIISNQLHHQDRDRLKFFLIESGWKIHDSCMLAH